MCQTQATASDRLMYNIFVPQKVLSKISDDITPLPPPNQKSWLRL